MEIRLNKFLTAFCKSFGNSTWKSLLQDYDNELTKYLLKKAGEFRYTYVELVMMILQKRFHPIMRKLMTKKKEKSVQEKSLF